MAHIKNLFYTFIWSTCPELFINGHIYAGVPPLYKITIGQNYKYLKDDNELSIFSKQNTGKKYIVNRMKGCEVSLALTHFSFYQRGYFM